MLIPPVAQPQGIGGLVDDPNGMEGMTPPMQEQPAPPPEPQPLPMGDDPTARVTPAEKNLLRIKLEGKDRDDLGEKLISKVVNAQTALSERFELIRMWREMYDARTYNSDWPWEGAANIVVPIVQSILDTIHARSLRVCRGVKPYFNVVAQRPEDEEVTRRIQQALQWVLEEEVNYGDKIDGILRVALESGNCFVKTVWEQRVETAMEMVDVDEALLSRLAQSGESAEEIDNIRRGAAEGFFTQVPIEEDRLVKDGPSIIPIDPLDFIVYPVNAESLNDSILHGHRIWLTKDDLLVGVDSGEYEKAAVLELIECDPRGDESSEMNGADVNRMEDNGISSSLHLDEEDIPYECYELLAKYQIREGRPAVWCVFTVEMQTKKIIKALRYPYWHQESCYMNYCPYPIPGQLWGRSVPDILRHLSTEIDSIRNARVNAGTLALTPIFTARRGSLLNTSGIEFSPGEIIQVDDPDSIKPLMVQPPPQTAFAEEAAAQREAERVTGASDVSQGLSPKSERTLGETQTVLSEGNLKFDTIIYRLQSTSQKMASQVIALLRQYMTPEMEMAITGTPEFEFMTISPQDLRRKWKIAAHGNSLNSNPELEAQVAEKVLMMIERLPWAGPSHLWAAAKNYLYKAGERNPIPYIGSEEEVKAFEQQQQNAPPPPPKTSVSAKLDPAASLAVVLQSNPDLAQVLQQAQMMIPPEPAPVMAPPKALSKGSSQ